MANTINQVTSYHKLTENSEQKIIDYVNSLQSNFFSKGRRERLLAIDKLLARVKEESEKSNIKVPIISPQVDTKVAYLAKLFLSGSPIFPVGTGAEGADVIAQYNTLLNKFAISNQWKRNLMLAFQDGVKYNLMATENIWIDESIQVANNTVDPNAPQATIETESSFAIRHLDLYNTFYDTNVPPSQISKEGDFAGYINKLSDTSLNRLLSNLPDEVNWKYREKLIWDNLKTATSAHYYRPQLAPDLANTTSEPDWDSLYAGKDGFRTYKGGAEVTTVYCRIVPKQFDIQVPTAASIQIWKFVIVAGKFVVSAQNRTSFHQYLPIVFGQPNETNLGAQKLSLVEELADIEKFASNLWNTEMISNNRTIGDRLIYDPSLIDEKHMNSAHPLSKIPVKAKAFGSPLNNAVYKIPFEDNARGTRAQLAQGVSSFANAVSGANQVSQGAFIKGNKTNSQFDTVMANSDSRQIMMAVLLEDQFISVIKKLLKSDLLQYQKALTIYDPQTQKDVQIDPAMLRSTKVNFILADGLVNIDQEYELNATTMFLQAIGASPDLQMQYNTGALFSYLAKLHGMKDMDKFMRSKEEVQAIQQQQAMMAQNAQRKNTP